MADFIFSRSKVDRYELSNELAKVYNTINIDIKEYHGIHGSVAYLKNFYNGFREYETEEFLFIVIGGPVLNFRDNEFITKSGNGNEGTRAIYKRWKVDDSVVFDSDLSGPFVLFYLNKINGNLEIVTDLMSFIPVYKYEKDTNLIIGTHINSTAVIAKRKIDLVSIVDFILNKVITFPFTVFDNIYQLVSGSIYKWPINSSNSKAHKIYWEPKEDHQRSINKDEKLSQRLRFGFENYIKSVINKDTKIAAFISGGEDSRSVLAAIPDQFLKKSIFFTEEINYESNIAKRVTKKHNSEFKLFFRNETYYLDNFKESCRLIGSAGDVAHAHSLGLHKKAQLLNYDVVFGGFLSDTLLKGHHVKKREVNKFFRFLPISEKEIISKKNGIVKNSILKSELIDVLNNRRQKHYNAVKTLRPHSAQEWFNIWPITMHLDYANIHVTRRLFRSYEPYTASEVVKVAALATIEHKLDRKLFQSAMKPFYSKTKWIPHANGSYPYLSWRYNNIFKYLESLRSKAIKFFYKRSTECSFSDWNKLLKTQIGGELVDELLPQIKNYGMEIFVDNFNYDIINNKELTVDQKRIVLQLGYQFNEKK